MTNPVLENLGRPFYWTRQGISLAEVLARIDAALALLQDATGTPQLGAVGLALYTADDPEVARAALGLTAGTGGGVSGSGPNGQFVALDIKDSTDVGRSVLTAAGVNLAARQLAAANAIAAVPVAQMVSIIAANAAGVRAAIAPIAASDVTGLTALMATVAGLSAGTGTLITVNATDPDILDVAV